MHIRECDMRCLKFCHVEIIVATRVRHVVGAESIAAHVSSIPFASYGALEFCLNNVYESHRRIPLQPLPKAAAVSA